MIIRRFTITEWLARRGSGRHIVDTERPCSICLQDFTLEDMTVVGPDGPGVSYLICTGCALLYDPHTAWHKADDWVSSITAGLGSQLHER